MTLLPVELYQLGRRPYLPVWEDMRTLTDTRDDQTPDQFWLVEHEPVFTQGRAGKPEHLLMPGDIPVVHTDRGGQVTYHGPGQVVRYPLRDVRRDGPGVYGMTALGEQKIASLGLRIRRGGSFHGVALNVDGDLSPFERINPCGYAGMQMARLADLTDQPVNVDSIGEQLAQALATRLQRSLVSKT